ncbi:hypothetical protein LZ31DRAFT_391438 [Colletotrichum somersetense]|nr:hypothetical protein LZ31DRAFT_391438 [Colletotrichum somersetense]
MSTTESTGRKQITFVMRAAEDEEERGLDVRPRRFRWTISSESPSRHSPPEEPSLIAPRRGGESNVQPLCHYTKETPRPSVTGSRSLNHHQHQRFHFFNILPLSIFIPSKRGSVGGRSASGLFFFFFRRRISCSTPPLPKLMCIQVSISPTSDVRWAAHIDLALHFTLFHIFTIY